MLAKLKDDFINHLHFSSRSTVLTFQMMPFPEKLQSQTTQILPPNSGQQINMLSKVCACAEMTFFGTAHRFYFDYFHISVHKFMQDRKHKTASWEEEVCVTLPSQIYSSNLHDYMANFVRNIKAFPNAIKNLVVYLLWNICFIHLKYVISMSKKDKMTLLQL